MMLLNKLVRIAYQWVGFRRFVDEVNDRLEQCATRDGIKVVEDGPLTIDRSDGEIKLGFIDPASGTPPLSFTEGSCIEITHNEDNEVEIGFNTETDASKDVVINLPEFATGITETSTKIQLKHRAVTLTLKRNSCGVALSLEASLGTETTGGAGWELDTEDCPS